MKQILLENVIKTYRFYAPLYDFLFGKILEPGRKELLKTIAEINPPNILEVGVGTGLTIERYPHSSNFVGVDVSEAMLKIAQGRADKLTGRNIRLEKMDGEHMNFPDGSFDCIAVPYVLSVTPDTDKFVAEIRRVCRKGGTILILNHFSGSRFWWLLETLVRSLANRIGFRSDFSYEQQIASHDWEVLSIKSVNLLGLSKLVTIRNT